MCLIARYKHILKFIILLSIYLSIYISTYLSINSTHLFAHLSPRQSMARTTHTLYNVINILVLESIYAKIHILAKISNENICKSCIHITTHSTLYAYIFVWTYTFMQIHMF